MNYTLEEYKELVFQELAKRINKDYAYSSVKEYEDDFPEFLEKELSVVAAGTAIIMGY